MQILDMLREMDDAEGVEFLKQFFNPLRGRAVGYLGTRSRGQASPVAQEEQDKIEEENCGGTPRQMDFTAVWTPVHHRAEAQGIRFSSEETSDRDKRTKEPWL
jgi:hypothetical protein